MKKKVPRIIVRKFKKNFELMLTIWSIYFTIIQCGKMLYNSGDFVNDLLDKCALTNFTRCFGGNIVSWILASKTFVYINTLI